MEIFKMFNEAGATLGRIIQQAEEVFLDVPRTEYCEEYKNNIKKVDFLMALTQKCITDAEVFLEPSTIYNLEGKTIDNVLESSEKKTPLEDFGRALQASFPTTKIYSPQLDQDLAKVGKYEKRLGLSLKSYFIKATENYVMILKKMLDVDLKKFKDDEAALELVRLDKDYMKNRMDNAYTSAGKDAMEKEYEKLKPVFDQQYEETKAFFRTINNYFTKHRQLLRDFVTIQRDYYRECDKNLTRLLRKLYNDSSKVTYSLPIDQCPDGFVSSSDVDEIIMRKKSAGVSKLLDNDNCSEIQFDKLPSSGGLIINLQNGNNVASNNVELDLEDETSVTPINLTNERNVQEPIFEASENEGIDLSADITPRDHCDIGMMNSKDISEAHPVRTIVEKENEIELNNSGHLKLANGDLHGSLTLDGINIANNVHLGFDDNVEGTNLETPTLANEDSIEVEMNSKVEASAPELFDSDDLKDADINLHGSLALGDTTNEDSLHLGIDSTVEGSVPEKPSLDISLNGCLDMGLDAGIVIKGEETPLPLNDKVSQTIGAHPDWSVERPNVDISSNIAIDTPSVNVDPLEPPDIDLKVNPDHTSLEASLPSIDEGVKIDSGSINLIGTGQVELNNDKPVEKDDTTLTGALNTNIEVDLPHAEIKAESHLGGNIDLGLHSDDLSTKEPGEIHLGFTPDAALDIKIDHVLPRISDDPVSFSTVVPKESEPLVIEPTSDKVEMETHLEHPDISLAASGGGLDLNFGSNNQTTPDQYDPGILNASVDIEPPSVHLSGNIDNTISDESESKSKDDNFSISAGIHDSENKETFGLGLGANIHIGNQEENLPPKPEGQYKFGFRNPKFDYQQQE